MDWDAAYQAASYTKDAAKWLYDSVHAYNKFAEAHNREVGGKVVGYSDGLLQWPIRASDQQQMLQPSGNNSTSVSSQKALSKAESKAVRRTNNGGRKRTNTRSKRKGKARVNMPRKYKRKSKRKMRRTKGISARQVKAMISRSTKYLESPIQVDRHLNGDSISCAVNLCSYNEYFIGSTTTLEGLLANYKKVDDAGAGDAVNTITMSTAGYNCRLKIVSGTEKLTMRNSIKIPVQVDLYWITPKYNASSAPSACLEHGADDLSLGDSDWQVEPWFYPGHAKTFRDLYRVDRHKKVFLEPGQSTVAWLKMKPNITYDPNTNDYNSHTYRRRFCKFMLIRLQGTVSHDQTTNTNVGFGDARLDIVRQTTYKYRFVQANNIKYDQYTDALDALAVAEQPGVDIADDIGG